MNDRISVARLLELDAAPTWREAVAITLEATVVAIGTRVNGRPVRVDAEACFVTADGRVELPLEAAAPVADGPRELLRAMLGGIEAPPDLVEVVYGGASTENLSDDLAQFSRPNRRVEIAAVAARGIAAEQQLAALEVAPAVPVSPPEPPIPIPPAESPPADPLADLRQHAAARRENAPSPPPPPPARMPSLRPGPIAGLAVLAATAAVAAWVLWPVGPAESAGPTIEARIETAETTPQPLELSPPDPAWSAAGRRTTDIVLARRSPRPTGTTTEAMAQPGVTTGSAETLPVVETSTGNGGSTSPNGGTAALPPLAATAIASINPEAFDEGTVYSWASRDVVPPVMLQPRMPRSAFPEFDEEVTGPFVEVLVNEQGGVDAVRLRGRMDQGEAVRYGMMLSAAKAWQFQAAHRGGRTVRYVVRVLITP